VSLALRGGGNFRLASTWSDYSSSYGAPIESAGTQDAKDFGGIFIAAPSPNVLSQSIPYSDASISRNSMASVLL